MSVKGWLAYDAASERYFETYERLNFFEVHRSLLPYLPSGQARCLDVGAGSGRDAAALAQLGHSVTAVEPSSALIQRAERRHKSGNIKWVQDSLPHLDRVMDLQVQYDFILVSAVWMHIPTEERGYALTTLAALLSADGRLAITLRVGPSDQLRHLYPVDVDEVQELAQNRGLLPVFVSEPSVDLLHRAEVAWQKIVLAKNIKPL